MLRWVPGEYRMQSRKEGVLKQTLRRIRRLLRKKPDGPEDPYAYVTAPKKPRPPYLSAAAVAEKPDTQTD